MDARISVPEKYGGIVGNDQSDFPSVNFVPYEHEHDYARALAILGEAIHLVNGVEPQELVPVKILDAQELEMTRAEVALSRYAYDACQIQLVEVDDEVVGVLVYRRIFDMMIEVRMLYIRDGLTARGLGKGIVSSIGKVKGLIFQTRKDQPPPRCLQITEKFRHVLFEDDFLITWQMQWG